MASKSYTLVMEERKKLTETIISNLEKNGLNWVKGWSSKFAPHNATTEKGYRGGNKLKLMVIAENRGYDDPRWVTFNQAKEKGWQVKKGSKSVALEKWIFSKKEKDKVTKQESIVKLKNPIVNYFRVFNANDIEGIPELKQEIVPQKTKEELTDLISNLKKSSECEIKEEKQDRAYYSSLQDHIVLPPQEAFISQEQYLGTMLHEMGHSTGHSDRLNRPLGNGFGSVDYAKEELRAEISAIFSQKELGMDLKTEHIDNHSAYINSWIKVLKEDPNEIYKASSDAEKITDRLVENYNKLEKTKVAEEIKALGVGESFLLIPKDEIGNIALKETDIIVNVDNINYPVFIGTTFEESQKIDKLFDTYNYEELNINDFEENDTSKFINPYAPSNFENPYQSKIKNPYSNDNDFER